MEKELERCIIFIDHANVYHNIQPIGGRIDYIKFREILSKGYHLVGTLFFAGLLKKVSKDKQEFYNFLESREFVIIFNSVQEKTTGELKQKGIDISIYANAVELAKIDAYEKAILVSGDGDFVRLVNKLKEMHKKIEIWSFKNSLSEDLKDAVGIGNFHYIDFILDEIEFRTKKHKSKRK